MTTSNTGAAMTDTNKLLENLRATLNLDDEITPSAAFKRFKPRHVKLNEYREAAAEVWESEEFKALTPEPRHQAASALNNIDDALVDFQKTRDSAPFTPLYEQLAQPPVDPDNENLIATLARIDRLFRAQLPQAVQDKLSAHDRQNATRRAFMALEEHVTRLDSTLEEVLRPPTADDIAIAIQKLGLNKTPVSATKRPAALPGILNRSLSEVLRS